VRPAWLARHVLADAAGVAADRRATALGAAVHAELIAAGDRLAAVSPALADRCYRHAPAAWTAFGPAGFRRWVALGEGLAAGDAGSVDAALAFFTAPPRSLGAAGPRMATAWCALAREVGKRSRRLAASFLRRTAGALGREDVLPRLRAWVAVGLRLHALHGWRGAILAEAFFDAEGVVEVLAPAQYAIWAETGVRIAAGTRERRFFERLPEDIAAWTDVERRLFLDVTHRLAGESAAAALRFYRTLPAALRPLGARDRGLLVLVFDRMAPGAAGALADLAPMAGALVAAVPGRERPAALAHVIEVAARSAEAAIAALRSLPRVYAATTPAGVQRWFAAGLAIAAGNAAAGRAFFALESRSSVAALHAGSTAATLEETHGLWRKVIQMLSGAPASARAVDEVTLRPPLEERPDEGHVALPARIDWRPSHEENCRLYRVITAVVAARREFGTYDFVARDALGEGLVDHLRRAGQPALLEDCFLLAEGVRLHHRLARAYPGLGADSSWAARCVLERAGAAARPPRTLALDTLLALALSAAPRPRWLAPEAATLVRRLVVPLALPAATVADAVRVAHALAAALVAPAARRREAPAGEPGWVPVPMRAPSPEVLEGEAPLFPSAAEGAQPEAGRELTLAAPDETPGAGRSLSAEELARLLAAGAELTQGVGEGGGGEALVTDLAGKLPAARRDRPAPSDAGRAPARSARRPASDVAAFRYDEWDDVIGDYRSRWCTLYEHDLAGDGGEFFGRALADYAELIPVVRREFQRIRPARYRVVRGLEDGEDFDLGAVVDARAERRARRPSSDRFYRSRRREEREVATLFLLDMSASTDEPVATPGPARPGRRIIDVTREALVVMAEALEELGDAYAIYGFSGQGRANVEVFRVKSFAERLGPTVRARVGGIAPRGSTRMGTAVRHAIAKLAAVASPAKHLLLLSDGFPQDLDYGEDRRTHTYGIRDTAVALREAETAGITPFCVTVDRAGHDYLRQMCDAARYMVIDDITALPRELPRIYRRLVRA
jgi:hypothetical protein